MSALADQFLDGLRELIDGAERKMADLKFENKKKDERIEDLERELALAHVEIERGH